MPDFHEGHTLCKALVCSPRREYANVNCLERQNFASLPDLAIAKKQHDVLKRRLRYHNCNLVDVAELPGHPNSVFTRDPMVMTRNGYIVLRMGLESRRGEEAWLEEEMKAQNFEKVGEIVPPGTVEGGDVIICGDTAFVGLSTRTNSLGVSQLKEILGRIGIDVRSSKVTAPYLHIGGSMTIVGPDTLILSRQASLPRSMFSGFKVIYVDDKSFVGGNVIHLGGNRILAEARNTDASAQLCDHGYSVEAIDLSEFLNGTGGPSCLIAPIDRCC